LIVYFPSARFKSRDNTKGVYERAKKGEIENFTGISSPYEEPENPEIVINIDMI